LKVGATAKLSSRDRKQQRSTSASRKALSSSTSSRSSSSCSCDAPTAESSPVTPAVTTGNGFSETASSASTHLKQSSGGSLSPSGRTPGKSVLKSVFKSSPIITSTTTVSSGSRGGDGYTGMSPTAVTASTLTGTSNSSDGSMQQQAVVAGADAADVDSE
jgi:hypothetical protein